MTQPSVIVKDQSFDLDRQLDISGLEATMMTTTLPETQNRKEATAAKAESLTWMSGWQIRTAIVERKYKALEVTEHFLARISNLDPVLHAFLKLDVDGARAQAHAADVALNAGGLPGALHGVPVALKDHIAVKGLPWPRRGHAPSDGTKISMDLAREDSVVAERLRKAGAILVGNTIMPGMGLGADMDDLARHPRNPWNPDLVPGSSSASSAAAVASGMLPVAIGSDGGGSTRLPAALCGVIGLHTTTGRVPNPSYDSAKLMLTGSFGPITRDVRDTAIILQAIAGPDGRGMLSTVHPPAPDYTIGIGKGAKGMKFGWTDDFGFAAKYFMRESAAIIARTHNAAHGFRALGAEVSRADIVLEDFWPHVASTMYHYEGNPQPEPVMRAAMEARGRNRAKFDALLEKHDFILSSTIPFIAPTVEAWDTDWKDGVSFAPFYTSETFMFNWLQLPAISIPVGFHNGMPIGLQLVGRPDSEPRMFAAAAAFLAKFPQIIKPKIS
jgi:aspartyl-tRNA(Asn)/glutamyl-tRNA(Gln) amidotransferase subunit A